MRKSPSELFAHSRSLDYPSMSDLELILAVRSRDQLALREIFRRHSPLLVATATKVTKSRTLAEEIVQEIMTRMWQEPEKFDSSRGSIRAFLLVQTHRRSIDIIRSESARSRREEKVNLMDRVIETPIDEAVVEKVQMRSLLVALAHLTEGERLAIELAYFHGHTYHEVAKILREPDGTVKSRIRTGLRKIRETLERGQLEEQDDNN